MKPAITFSAALSLAIVASLHISAQTTRPAAPSIKPPPATPTTATVQAQPLASLSGCNPSTRELRATVLALRSQQPPLTDGAFFVALDKFVGVEIIPPFQRGVISIHESDELSITLMPRYAAFHFGLEDALRKMDPIDTVQIIEGHTVHVAPARMDAPDIIKVVLQRNGVIVPPLQNALATKVFQNRMGASATLHAGDVVFPCSAFTADAIITITAIPESGSNITKRLRLDEVRTVR